MDELFGLKMKGLNDVLHVTREEIRASPRMTEALQREKKTKDNLKRQMLRDGEIVEYSRRLCI